MKALQDSLKRAGVAMTALFSIHCALAQDISLESEPVTQAEAAQLEEKPSITYISGYKYHLHEDYAHTLSFDTGIQESLGFIELDGDRLLLRKGYGWDGASGPVFDTKTVMRATAVHDALYRLIRYERLSEAKFKEPSDQELIRILEEDGMPKLGRYWMHKAVKQFGLKGVREIGIKKVRSTADKSGRSGTFTNLASSSNSSGKS